MSQKRVRRLWSQLGLQLPRRRSRKRRLGSEVRLPGAPVPNSVWTYDFVHDRLAVEVNRSMSSMTVIDTLARLMRLHGKPSYIRSDQGAEFTAGAVMRWLRDECLSREWFRDMREARVLIERWRRFYNEHRPRSALGYLTPAAARKQWQDGAMINQALTA